MANEIKPADANASAENAAQETVLEPAKKDKRKKNPTDPTVLPFQLVTPENRERIARIGKPNNDTLSLLLDVFENQGNDTANVSNVVIIKLQEENKSLKQQHEADLKAINSCNELIQKQQDTIATHKQQIADKEQLIAALEQKNAALTEQIEKFQTDSNSASAEEINALTTKLQEMTDRATRAEDEVKDNRTTIDGLRSAKHELEKLLNETSQERDEARNAYLNAERQIDTPTYTNEYAEGDILHFFPTTTARMLELTAERLTAKRKDGIVVTPQMILGDMFNKYTIQRWNNWFYWFVLDDKDIIEIAQSIDNRLTSIHMVKAALGIN